MATLYRIKDWGKHFENNRTRELKSMAWVPVPNKMDGDGFTDLIDHKNGAAHYGSWMAILLVASRCDPRGTLLRDCAEPHSVRSLSRMTRIPEATLAKAVNRLIDIGWLETETVEDKGFTSIPQEGAEIPQEGAAMSHPSAKKGREGKEGNGKNGTEQQAALPPELDTVAFGKVWADWEQHRREIKHPLTDSQRKAQIKKLTEYGHDNAIERLSRSISNGWRGFDFPDGGKGGGNHRGQTPTAASQRRADEAGRMFGGGTAVAIPRVSIDPRTD